MANEVLILCSNIITAVSYFVLTFQLYQFAMSKQIRDLFATLINSKEQKKRNLFKMVIAVAGLFASFIMLCGCTHGLSVLRFYQPNSEAVIAAQTAMLVFCAAVSLITAVCSYRLFPVIRDVLGKFELNAEGNIQLAENYLIEIVEMVKESILVISEDFTVTRCNEASKALFCSTSLLGENITNFIHPQDLHTFHDTVNRVLSSYSLIPVTIEYRIRHSAQFSTLSAVSHSSTTNGSKRTPRTSSRGSSKVYVAADDATDDGMTLALVTKAASRSPSNATIGIISAEANNTDANGNGNGYVHSPSEVKSASEEYIWVESTICKGMRITQSEDFEYDLKIVTRNVDDKKKEAITHFQNILRENEERGRINAAKLRYLSCIAHDLKTPLQSFCFTLDLLGQSNLLADQREYVQQANVAVDLMKLTISQTMDISKALTGAKLMPRRTTVYLSSVLHRVQIIINGYGKQVPISFEIASDVNDTIITDEEWLWQMLLNLLTNACKYTDKGEIRVMLSQEPAGISASSQSSMTAFDGCALMKDMLKVEVFDTGVGISPDKIDHVFDAFAQVQDGQVTGTGLGLFGVRMRAEGLQGTCGARYNTESSTGTGTVLWFAIPYVPDSSDMSGTDGLRTHSDSLSSMEVGPPVTSSPEPATPVRAGNFVTISGGTPVPVRNKSIKDLKISPSDDFAGRVEQQIRTHKLTAFVIDDTLTVRKLMEKLLLRMGFDKVQCYENGSKGLDAMMAEPVDIVFSDVQMPIMTGPEMIRRFRRWETDALHSGQRSVRQLVVAVTANGSEIGVNAESSFNEVCPKPLSVADIFQLISKYFC